jgi:hypothetical protein
MIAIFLSSKAMAPPINSQPLSGSGGYFLGREALRGRRLRLSSALKEGRGRWQIKAGWWCGIGELVYDYCVMVEKSRYFKFVCGKVARWESSFAVRERGVR